MTDSNEFLSVRQAAEAKGCSRQTIYNAIERGDLNGSRVGTYRVVLRDDAFERWEVKEKYRESPNR